MLRLKFVQTERYVVSKVENHDDENIDFSLLYPTKLFSQTKLFVKTYAYFTGVCSHCNYRSLVKD